MRKLPAILTATIAALLLATSPATAQAHKHHHGHHHHVVRAHRADDEPEITTPAYPVTDAEYDAVTEEAAESEEATEDR